MSNEHPVAVRLRLALAELPPCSGLVVALSGGLDSTVLLHALAALPEAHARGLRACHVDHGLHADSPAWAEMCRNACARLGVDLTTVSVTVPETALGLEGEARVRRYAALREQLQAGEVLLTAHHADDQAETLLARLARAAGSSALQGIVAWSAWPPGFLWRPLLPLPRGLLEHYARHHSLGWIDDPMNAWPELERGFLRQRVLPVLTERWPEFAAQAARSAALLGHAVAAETTKAQRDLALVQHVAPGVLSLDALLELADDDLLMVVRAWLQNLALPPAPARLLDELRRQLRQGSEQLHLAHGSLQIRQYRRALYAFEDDPPCDWPEQWDGHRPLRTHGSRQLCASAPLAQPVWVRPRLGGERIRLQTKGRQQELRDLFQRFGIPPWQRDEPLLFVGDTLVAVGHLFLADIWPATVGAVRLRRVALSPDGHAA